MKVDDTDSTKDQEQDCVESNKPSDADAIRRGAAFCTADPAQLALTIRFLHSGPPDVQRSPRQMIADALQAMVSMQSLGAWDAER